MKWCIEKMGVPLSNSGTEQTRFFEILACISDNYLRITTAHTQILQHYPPSLPQGGDGFDLCIFIGYKYWVRQ
jgi:hypothetical protein